MAHMSITENPFRKTGIQFFLIWSLIIMKKVCNLQSQLLVVPV